MSFGNVICEAVWALGNIGGDGSDCRDMLLELDVMDTLLNMMQQPQKRWRRGKNTSRYLAKNESVSLSMKRTIIWTISNLCRGKPQPEFDIVTKSTSLCKYSYCNVNAPFKKILRSMFFIAQSRF